MHFYACQLATRVHTCFQRLLVSQHLRCQLDAMYGPAAFFRLPAGVLYADFSANVEASLMDYARFAPPVGPAVVAVVIFLQGECCLTEESRSGCFLFRRNAKSTTIRIQPRNGSRSGAVMDDPLAHRIVDGIEGRFAFCWAILLSALGMALTAMTHLARPIPDPERRAVRIEDRR
jgi:hypothetical protein